MLLFIPVSESNTPGLYALLGAASFFAGVTRLTVSLTIIMIELSGDVLLAFPLMVSIMVAKNVADTMIHPLYHEQLALKGVPYLDQPSNIHGLDTLTVSNVMTEKVIVLQEIQHLGKRYEILDKHDFSSFPVVSEDNIYKGMIQRSEINILLTCKKLFIKSQTDPTLYIMSWREYKSLLDDPVIRKKTPSLSPGDLECYIDLKSYINTGVYSVQSEFLLKDAYEFFRTLGLTHIMVVNLKNELVGVITRKDLLGENLVLKRERKHRRIHNRLKNIIRTGTRDRGSRDSRDTAGDSKTQLHTYTGSDSH